ncbi:HIT family protein [Rhodocyclaceae bacterium SMB388]
MTCSLCSPADENLIWQDGHCRVIRVDDPVYPGFCRVIWKDHVAEMTDLGIEQRHHLMKVVMATEQALRTLMRPDKINLASLGNFVPHLHWHVIPRFRDDTHFPEAIWSSPQRVGVMRDAPAIAQLCEQIAGAVG